MVNSSTQFYKLATTPRGRQLWIYMAAILEVTEMDQGKSFPLKRFLGNFQTHLAAGRIERVPEGFSYTSDNNPEWMSGVSLKQWIADNQHKIGKI